MSKQIQIVKLVLPRGGGRATGKGGKSGRG
jgi:hypothetical protein